MQKHVLFAITLLSVAFTPLIAPTSQTLEGSSWQAIPQPYKAPNVSWFDAQGTRQTLQDLEGHVVVLNLWATWCRPCLLEMPTLDKLERRYHQAGLRVMPVAVPSSGGFAHIDTFYRRARLNYLPQLLATHAGMLGPFMSTSLPTTYVIDKRGNVVAEVKGAEDWFSEEIQNRIEGLLRVDRINTLSTPDTTAPMILDT